MAGSTPVSLTAEARTGPALAGARRPVTPGQEAWRRFRKHRLALVSLVVLALMVLAVAIGPLLWHVAINDIDFSAMLHPPDADHPLGTDDLGQDVLARLLYGGRISLAVGLAAMLVAVVVGVFVGAVSGMSSGPVDAFLMWLTDLFLSLPQLPLLLLIIYLFRDQLKAVFGAQGGVFLMIVIVIGGLRWMPVARLVRAQFLSLREKEFVEAARALGASTARLVAWHILPNALGPVIVAATIEVANAIIAEFHPLLPRPRLPARHPHLGSRPVRCKGHARRRPALGARRRLCDLRHRAGHQLHRRRPARRARPAARPLTEPLLAIDGLKTWFKTDDGMVRAVDGVSMAIWPGETLAVVGESGCGKTVTARSVLKLIDMPPGRFEAGQIRWQGRDLVPLSGGEMDKIRAREIGMVFQEPMTSLNPVYRVGEQIAEAVRAHRKGSDGAAMDTAIEMLRLVQIPDAARRINDYPHQFSGGMRQRVMIAMALACQPKLLIADEPTTALDVTIQAQILELLDDMKGRFGMAIMLITHDMGVVAERAQRVVVMYAGKVVEEADVVELFGDPRHPYTQGLIRSIPRVDADAGRKARLEQIPGSVPSLLDPPPGCRFAARCKFAMPACTAAEPPLRTVGPNHKSACILD